MGYIKRLNAPDMPAFFEISLYDVGLLSSLEQAGIIPDPDPFELDTEQFNRELEQRKSILKNMEIGATLQRYFPHLAPHLVPEEDTLSRDQQDIIEQRKSALLDALVDTNHRFIWKSRFEIAIERRGLWQRLNEIGVWPDAAISPNPYEQGRRFSLDVLEEIEQHTHWWTEHPEESEKFDRDVDRTSDVPQYMYIGALIARNFPDIFQAGETDDATNAS
jgi:hypothetical protein